MRPVSADGEPRTLAPMERDIGCCSVGQSSTVGIYGRGFEQQDMSRATEITLGTIGVSATLAIALVFVYLV